MENSKSPSVLKVIAVETRYDKNREHEEYPEGRPYKWIQVQTKGDRYVDVPGVGRVLAAGLSRISAFTAYPVNYLGNADPGHDFKVNQFVLGDIVTREVEAYDITGDDGLTRTVNIYSTVVLGDSTNEASWEAAIANTFRRRGQKLLNAKPSFTVSEQALKEFDKSSDAAAAEGARVAAAMEKEEISNESGI